MVTNGSIGLTFKNLKLFFLSCLLIPVVVNLFLQVLHLSIIFPSWIMASDQVRRSTVFKYVLRDLGMAVPFYWEIVKSLAR